MFQKSTGILIDAVRAGAFEFILPITTREKAAAKGVSTTPSEQVPHTVADHDGGMNVGSEPLRSPGIATRSRIRAGFEEVIRWPFEPATSVDERTGYPPNIWLIPAAAARARLRYRR